MGPRSVKGSKGLESHPVGGINLITEGGDIVVQFEYEGTWYEAIREVADGPISHCLHANGIKAIIQGEDSEAMEHG